MSLDVVRTEIDGCGAVERRVFARRTRNALAIALVRGAEVAPTGRRPPAGLRDEVGNDLADLLADVYAGGPGWTSSAIEALQPLHDLARRT